jgi:hypothetical protein
MSLKSVGRRLSKKNDITKVSLSFWGVIGVAMFVIAVLIGMELGKYLLGKGKRVLGRSVPGGGVAESRGAIGV